MSAGELDDFDRELEGHLTDFLKQLTSSGDAIELVINGDFLDFVQAPPWRGRSLSSQAADGTPLSFTEAQSRSKLGAIAGEHQLVFAALGNFLDGHPKNTLVLVPGNHDADLHFDGVQSDLLDLIAGIDSGRRGRLRIHLEHGYAPPGYQDVWIEHGHQYDNVNCFSNNARQLWGVPGAPILLDRDGVPRLYECVGTRFLVRYLNALDADYPFVDNVKPFGRFLRVFGASAFVPGWGPLRAALALKSILLFLTGRVFSRPSDVLGVDADSDEDETDLHSRLQTAIRSLPAEQRAFLLEQMKDRGYDLKGRSPEVLLDDAQQANTITDFFAENPDLVDILEPVRAGVLSTDGPDGTLTLGRGFRADETGDLLAAAGRIHRDRGASTVVMGHTHEPIEKRSEFLYCNTGSWTRYYRFEQTEKTRAWSLLRSQSFVDFPYRLLYFEATPDGARGMKLHRERSSDE